MRTSEKIYHFTLKSSYLAAKKTGQYEHPSLATEGFIHASTANLLSGSIQKHAPKEGELVLLIIDPEKVAQPLVFENNSGGKDLYPHIYGPLNLDAVLEVRPLMKESDKKFMQEAIRLSKKGIDGNEGGPFGAVVVKDGKIIGSGNNRVTSTNDPTAHAEVVAIRDACKNLASFQLDGCVIYTSCEPCPMCLGAIYWARPDKIVYACSREDAAAINFDDDLIYKEIALPIEERSIPTVQYLRKEGFSVFQAWAAKNDKVEY